MTQLCLCNTSYKLITKILDARLRPLLYEIVKTFQASFVPGRREVANVINLSFCF